MKLFIKRLMAGLLLTALIVSGVPSATLFAAGTTTADTSVGESEAVLPGDITEDDSDDSGDTQTESEQNNEEITDNISQDANSVSEKTDETAESTGEEQEPTDADTTDENISASADGEESNSEQTPTGDINFVYVESPYLETPGTQRIVFYFNEEIKDAQEITLTVADSAGNEEEWQLAESKSGLYLFEKEYTGEAYTDTYHAVSLNLYNNDGEDCLNLTEMGVEAEFGVNQEYEGINELEPLDDSENLSDEDVEASVVTIGEDGVTEAQDDIAGALESVAESRAANSISLYSRAAVQAKTSDDIVVALDPGHDENDAGAQGNGLKEEVLTLKIANYCKDELEKYAGVSVFMTRTTYECPYDCSSSGECIQARVDAAKEAGAEIFVSFHLNSSTVASANGAEVIIPNKNWKPSLGTTGEKLAEEILDELVKLGLTERSIYSRNSESGTKYSDGSTADYFAVPRMCKEVGIAGIIVEHAFISNSSDVNKFLKTESGLKKLGVADATGIAQYLDLSKDTWTKPKLKTPSAASQGTQISWGSVKGATGYAVYRKTGTEGWKMIDTTTSTSYVDDDILTNGRTYYYTVRAYKGTEEAALANKYSSAYWTSYDSDGVQAVYMTTPTVSSTVAASSGIKLSWQKVSGVTGYAVYRKTSGSGWGMIGTTTSTSYTDTSGLKNGTTYYYTLRAYKGNVNTAKDNKYNAAYWSGYNTAGVSGKYYSTPVLSDAKASATGTTVSWQKVSGASGYAVYRKVSGGSWATIATTTSTSYTDKTVLTNGKTYYYTVRAYVGSLNTAQDKKYDSNYWSYYNTTGLKTVYLDSPDLTGTTTASSGIKVTWKKVTGAAGYAVYRKTASTGWSMIDTTTSTSYTDKDGMKNGSVYYYTVRAYAGNVTTAKKNKYDAQYWSGYDNSGVQGRFVTVPSISGEKASASGRTITWKSVSNVSGYAIYRKVSGGSWGMIDTTTSTSYTDTDKLTNGKTYYYTVRAYVGNADTATANKYDSSYWSYYDTTGIKTVYTTTPALDTAVKLSSGIRVTWSAVSGASGYAVYRKAPGGSWGMIDTTTSTSYTDKNSGSTAYYYTVRAYRGNVTTAKANKYSSIYWSGYESDGVTISDLDTPKLDDTKVVNTGLQISWNAVKGADGYAVYRKTATTGWGMIGTSTSTIYLDTEAGASGTVYYYTVRAYRGGKDTAISNKYDSEYWSYYDTNGVTGSAYEIEGKSDVTVEEMVNYYNTYSSISYPADALKEGGAATIEDLAQIFYEEATDEGIKPEVVWCQTMLETNYLKFGGDVKIDQYNFAGLGALGNGNPGFSFSTVREGIRAQVQHMKAYASDTITADALKHDLVDPRFQYVTKGAAKYVEILGSNENPLGTGWATSVGYGKNIVLLIQRLKQIG